MKVTRFEDIAAKPLPKGPLGAAIAAAEAAPRTLPRDSVMREILISLGEPPERLGPPRAS